jgi:hypothetical protein
MEVLERDIATGEEKEHGQKSAYRWTENAGRTVVMYLGSHGHRIHANPGLIYKVLCQQTPSKADSYTEFLQLYNPPVGRRGVHQGWAKRP